MICLHGYRSDGQADCQEAAEKFWSAGYNVLVPDLRAHGRSEGKDRFRVARSDGSAFVDR